MRIEKTDDRTKLELTAGETYMLHSIVKSHRGKDVYEQDFAKKLLIQFEIEMEDPGHVFDDMEEQETFEQAMDEYEEYHEEEDDFWRQ